MKLSAAATLICADLRARWARNLVLALALGVGCAVLALISSAALSIRRTVIEDVIEAFPATQIEVRQKQVSFFGFKLGKFASPLDETVLRAIERIPGVKQVLPEVLCHFPAALHVNVLTADFFTETCIFGVTPELVEDVLPEGHSFAHSDEAEVIPAVISKALLSVFNTEFAPTRRLPKLDESLAKGLEFDLYLGASTMGGKNQQVQERRVRIVGISPRVALVGLSVPLPYVDEWNEWWTGSEKHTGKFRRLIVQTTSPRKTDAVAKAIEALDMDVASGKDRAENLNSIVELLNLLVAVLSVAVAVLTGVGVLNAAALNTAERMGWIGLMRACGATRLTVVTLLAAESGIVGLTGGALGVLTVWLTTHWLDASLLERLPPLVAMPETLFADWCQLALMAGGGVTALAVVAALWPALRAAFMDPAEALTRD